MTTDKGPNKDKTTGPGSTDPAKGREPWWADDGPEEQPLPDGFPERPDIQKVHDLRENMHRERAAREALGGNPLSGKINEKTGKQAREIGSYTLIPAMMLAGPAVGYGLGWLLEKKLGGDPWVSVFGILFGMAAAFRQIILILKKNSETP